MSLRPASNAPVQGNARTSDVPPRRVRVLGPLGVAGVVGLAAVALHFHDPHQTGSWGQCPSLYFFGIACPLCGGLRAVNDMTNGHFVEAFWSNALFVSSIPLFVYWWTWAFLQRWRGSRTDWHRPLEMRGVFPTIMVLLVTFAIFRNTPWGARFYPS